jgi:hypothetical protein
MTSPARAHGPITARTLRFPSRLRERIAADSLRCGRSFEAHVLAILRRHYGEDVDLAPEPGETIALAQATLPPRESEIRQLTRKLTR